MDCDGNYHFNGNFNNANDLKAALEQLKNQEEFKTLVEKMGCLERPVYFLGNNGNIFNMVPSREFFRKNYDDLNIKFDYHVNFNVNEEDEEMNDFNIKLKLDMNDSTLIDMNILVKFSSGEMSGKLSAKYKFDLADNFN
jgi:hypothetical protein